MERPAWQPEEKTMNLPMAGDGTIKSEALSILLVDDDTSNLEYLSAIVEALGYEVETANSGMAALQRLAQPPRPDLVIVDVVMPQLDGVETQSREPVEHRLQR